MAPRVLIHRQRPFCLMEAPSWAAQSVLGVTQGLPGFAAWKASAPDHGPCSPATSNVRGALRVQAPRPLRGPGCRRPSLGQCSTSPHPKECLGAPAAGAHFLGTQRPEVSTCPHVPLR